jgi:holo-[acyl-carrier protein] synthase
MIFGIGVDVLRAERTAQVLARFGGHFTKRLLMPAELRQFKRTKRPERFLALRFAAKEAIVKALGTGFAHGVWIRDVGVVQNEWGRPEVVYSARGERLRRKLGVGEGHVSLTDEDGLVVAVAVLMRADDGAVRAARTTAKLGESSGKSPNSSRGKAPAKTNRATSRKTSLKARVKARVKKRRRSSVRSWGVR